MAYIFQSKRPADRPRQVKTSNIRIGAGLVVELVIVVITLKRKKDGSQVNERNTTFGRKADISNEGRLQMARYGVQIILVVYTMNIPVYSQPFESNGNQASWMWQWSTR